MNKYLYLTEYEWADAWINGGKIPLKLASAYLSDTRSEILTPDENLIHNSEYPINGYEKFGIKIGLGVKDISISNNYFNGEAIPNVCNADYYEEDGLILSFSNTYDKEIMKKLGKKACIKVTNMKRLKTIIDKQLRCNSTMKECEYTDTHNRNHFLKSTLDMWQNEFRLFWKTTSFQTVDIVIPSNIGTLVI